MSQQASNEFYDDEAELAMDLAVAVNEEVRDLFAAGADVVQIDEPWLQSRAEKARAFALPAINRALEGATGTTALHTCFGYAHVVHDRPDGYPFLAELADCAADVLAIEAAQPKLDPRLLEPIAGKTVIVGVLDLGDPEAETPDAVAAPHRGGAHRDPRGAPAGRPRLRDEVPAARPRVREAARAGRGRPAGARLRPPPWRVQTRASHGREVQGTGA